MDNRLSVRAGSTRGGGKNAPEKVDGLTGGVILRCTAPLTGTTGFVVGDTRCLPRGEG
ncbi:hypothetical protein [Terrabacter sp. Ter38]|uniref:hypothetical protein n=1 Tax=Terrabacter sp. Ter38 TaxID=2926030 RepID=UPI002117FEAD|nr:hypothetical protein [Terrabacter sp. Ter38]